MSDDKPKLTLVPGGLTDEKAELIGSMTAPLHLFYAKLADLLDIVAEALDAADEADAATLLMQWSHALAGFRDHFRVGIRTAARMTPASSAGGDQMMRTVQRALLSAVNDLTKQVADLSRPDDFRAAAIALRGARSSGFR